MTFKAPLKDILFTMQHVAGLEQVAALPGFEEAGPETAAAILEECARLNEEVIAPLNVAGDTEPPKLDNGQVTTSPGFKQAYEQFAAGGWQGIVHPTEYGGAGLPKLLATPCVEILNAANLSFSLAPLLTDGAIEALLTAGDQAQCALYLPELISGNWTGTMNLTEPQAGSDLSLVRSRAAREADGTYRISGQKIYITFGEHDMAENIVHMVLARTPDAPEGVKGISLFIVPKYLPDENGKPGKRNDVYCTSIEHKLGIHASPTAVLIYGDDKGEVGPGAVGYLIGEENRGLQYMFVMMNAARFAVGMQGIGVSERAYQKALMYARDRVQSRDVAGSAGPVAIIQHPDVRRMLMTMKAYTEAARSLAYVAAAACDAGHHAADEQTRQENRAVYEYLVPIVKGWSTEMSLEVTSLGVQIHGGMGFIEETGAAQYYRDARILTIYEGTTAIQANDLVGRKTARDGGKVARALIAQIRETEQELAGFDQGDLAAIRNQLAAASAEYEAVVDYVLESYKGEIRSVFAGSVPYLRLAGVVLGGWQLARAALAAHQLIGDADADKDFLSAKIATARFYADHILVLATALRTSIVQGAPGALALTEEQF